MDLVRILKEDCGGWDQAMQYARKMVFMARANGNSKMEDHYQNAIYCLLAEKQKYQA